MRAPWATLARFRDAPTFSVCVFITRLQHLILDNEWHAQDQSHSVVMSPAASHFQRDTTQL